MLRYLHLKNVGPAPELEMELAPRLNLITGDNGLGKSFLLDVAWWALTRRWPHDLNDALTSGYPARPSNIKEPAAITFGLDSKSGVVTYSSSYVREDEAWQGKAGRPWNPGLIIYAHADGGFSVWDPARNYWRKRGNIDVQERLPGYVLAPKDVWEGLTVQIDGRPTVVCNGLIVDWASWIREKGPDARLMEVIVQRLVPDGEVIEVGPLVRLSVNDARDIPSIRTAYSQTVPIVHASAGLRRVMSLAYLLLWSWNEHERASEQLGDAPTHQVVMVFDEIESHLHPRWQRTILRAVVDLAKALHRQASVQLIAATHSPLILASAEPFFDEDKDAWFDLDLESGSVILRRRPFVPHGDVSNWLTSKAFDLKRARSLEAEQAIEAATALLVKGAKASSKAVKAADDRLRSVGLPDIDPFWVRWSHFMEGGAGRDGKRRTR